MCLSTAEVPCGAPPHADFADGERRPTVLRGKENAGSGGCIERPDDDTAGIRCECEEEVNICAGAFPMTRLAHGIFCGLHS